MRGRILTEAGVCEVVYSLRMVCVRTRGMRIEARSRSHPASEPMRM